ncbi:OmpH family outer membrane protein [Minwuia thermotolerans]|nr:OmpH family outer membrane protein [Minwuia thermotolerans]
MTRFLSLIVLFAMLGVAAVQHQAAAQSNPPAVIATMDSQRILREAKAGKSVASQIKSFIDELQAVIKREDEALKARQDELRQQAAILSPDALEQRRAELQQSFNDAQRMVQDRRVAIDQTRQQALEVIKGQMLDIIEELQQERDFNVVLDRSSYSWALPSLDITDEIVKRLDQRLPSVSVARPKGF